MDHSSSDHKEIPYSLFLYCYFIIYVINEIASVLVYSLVFCAGLFRSCGIAARFQRRDQLRRQGMHVGCPLPQPDLCALVVRVCIYVQLQVL